MKFFKMIGLCSAIVLALAFTGCKKEEKKEIVIIKMFSNLPDRQHGQGLIEQKIIDKYMDENPEIKIEVEALSEQSYKIKFNAYCREEFPDVVSIWGEESFLSDAIDAGILHEISEEDFEGYGFYDGSLDGFSYENKVYGLPRNTDIAVLYYNRSIFDENNWKIPSSKSDMLSLIPEMEKKNIIPVALAGGDRWPLMVLYSDILHDLTMDDYNVIVSKAIDNADFSDKHFKEALDILKQFSDSGLFQKNFIADDYGAAQNLFLTGKAAMYYIGSWECSMAVRTDLSDQLRSGIRVTKFPALNNNNNVLFWYGGGYAVSKKTKHEKEVMDFFKYLFKMENLSRIGLENCVGLSAQNEMSYLNGTEPVVLKQLTNLRDEATYDACIPLNDYGSSSFKVSVENNMQKFISGVISAGEFLKSMEQECRK